MLESRTGELRGYGIITKDCLYKKMKPDRPMYVNRNPYSALSLLLIFFVCNSKRKRIPEKRQQ